jgi:hypothetical protein
MPTGTRAETKTLDRLCALAAAQTGIGSSRVAKGYRRWSENEHFQERVRALAAETQGYFWAALQRVANAPEREWRAVTCAAELVLYVPAQASTDLNAAWEFALNLKDVLESPSNYGDGEFPPRITVEMRGIEALAEGGVTVFEFAAASAAREGTKLP